MEGEDGLAEPSVASRRAEVLARIAAAAARVSREASSIRIVAVTKTVTAERIHEAIEAGFDTLGENRVQERAAKSEALEPLVSSGVAAQPTWHLVGPLQSNKARRAIELFDVIETVDSLDLAARLDRIASGVRPGERLRVLLQVNVDDDPAKFGFDPERLKGDLPAILDLPSLEVDGLMTVGRLVDAPEDARPTFIALRRLSERLRAVDSRLGPALSVGMSDDFEIAVEEGATHVRLGRVIFGARPPVG
jgi:PLP dependent protein